MARKKKVEAAVEPLFPKTFDSGIVVESVKDLKNHPSGVIDMTVMFKHLGFEVPFAAHNSDDMEHGRWLYEEALKGTFGDIAEYDRPLPTAHDLQVELDKIWPDVVLGTATDEELELAKNLRKQIKAMS